MGLLGTSKKVTITSSVQDTVKTGDQLPDEASGVVCLKTSDVTDNESGQTSDTIDAKTEQKPETSDTIDAKTEQKQEALEKEVEEQVGEEVTKAKKSGKTKAREAFSDL